MYVTQFEQAFNGATQLFLDTAPAIYYIERNSSYFAIVQRIFQGVQNNTFQAVTSPITLSECLILPTRQGLLALQQEFNAAIVNGENTILQSIDAVIGRKAAELRVKYNLKLPDALQVGTAIVAGCYVFLTNDSALKRVQELRVVVIGDLVI
ncbi:type II toxin-antitoxin system VapC family toxin [Cyanobacteria bacterium FACHB-DQ100]|nr:type II toxin-antitoxin system VapC family toxin [Cyanobacteria bacterium FACHB-DQ100]